MRKFRIPGASSLLLLLGIGGFFSSGGNGNPAILLMPLFFIMYGLLLWRLFDTFRSRRLSILKLFLLTALTIGWLFFTSYRQSVILQSARDKLAAGMLIHGNDVDDQHIHMLTSGLTQATNAVYFNIWTYLSGIAVCIVAALWSRYMASIFKFQT